MTTRNLSLLDHCALAYLASGHDAATWMVVHATGSLPRWECNNRTRTMLLRLERWGLVERVTTIAGGHSYWRITDAGRKAVQP